MKTDYKEQIISYLHEVAPNAEGVFMDPKRAIFEECVKMNCFYCGKYGRNWRCPPNMPNIDYQKMFNEYDEGLFISYTYVYSDKVEFDNIRTESSVTLHKTLLDMEKKGIDTYIECGPGKVLQGLVKKTLKDVTILGINNMESLEAAANA